ncbi:PREDICTED: mitochondrial inner membrane protease ATP23 homolog, partial [Myotis davidii]|uniref:mitochondrial inner membrane protease ATP23 homolog n=1 Tax=Myotis davidii TaxID=225400 RepID=UPI000766FA1D
FNWLYIPISIHNQINIFLDPYVKLLLDAMKRSGCAVNRERHFSCEDCTGNVSGGFDASVSQLLPQASLPGLYCYFVGLMLVHFLRKIQRVLGTLSMFARALLAWKAFVDPYIRAANLSGDCSLVNEIFRLRFGLKQHHQTCVRDRAILSILAVRNVSKEVAEKAVDEVFESCFNDHEPFGRIPHNKTYAKYAHRDFQNRHRYYSNI